MPKKMTNFCTVKIDSIVKYLFSSPLLIIVDDFHIYLLFTSSLRISQKCGISFVLNAFSKQT